MSKWKAGVITVTTAVMLGGILYLTNSYAIRSFRIFEFILAAYGYVQAIYVLYQWLREPVQPETGKHETVDMEPVRSGDTIPKTWINPFAKNTTKKEEPESEPNS